MQTSRAQQVIDFPATQFEGSEEIEPEPAGHADYSDLRNHVATIRAFVLSMSEQAEHLIHVGQDYYLHLFSDSESFGIYGKDPRSMGRIALEKPLVTTGMYLRVPLESRSKEGYVAGLATKRISCRSVRHIISLCAEFLSNHEELDSRNEAPSGQLVDQDHVA